MNVGSKKKAKQFWQYFALIFYFYLIYFVCDDFSPKTATEHKQIPDSTFNGHQISQFHLQLSVLELLMSTSK